MVQGRREWELNPSVSDSDSEVLAVYSSQAPFSGGTSTALDACLTPLPPYLQFDSRKNKAQLGSEMKDYPKLVTRVCKCGCRRKWKCLPKSKSQFFSVDECVPPKKTPARLEFTNRLKLIENKYRK